jgi:cytoskeletal protein CcmA (bactofilin family)
MSPHTTPSVISLAFMAGVIVTTALLQPAQAQAPLANRNLYMGGGQVRPTAPVEGDFLAVGGKITIDQSVKGDAMLAGGSIEVRAPVGDDVRAAGGDISIESTVGGELYVTGGNLAVTKTAKVSGPATLWGGTVTIDGKIDGPLVVRAQRIVLNGEVANNARLTAEDIELGPESKISGALSYAVAGEIKKAAGATIGGSTTRDDEQNDQRGDGRSEGWERSWQRHMELNNPGWVGPLFTFFAMLACAAVFLLLFPGFSARATDKVNASPWLALVVGIGALLGVPVLAGLLILTILGIPVAIAVLAFFPFLLLVGYVVGVLFVSRRAQQALHRGPAPSFGVTIGFFALALLLVMLLARLPFVGVLALFLITMVGVGACLLELFRSRPQASQTPQGVS